MSTGHWSMHLLRVERERARERARERERQREELGCVTIQRRFSMEICL